MINILKLRKMEKEKSEGTKKPVNPDDEVVSLDEGKVVEEKNGKKIDSKKTKKETAEEKKKKVADKDKKTVDKKKKVAEKKQKVEKKKTSDKKKKVSKNKTKEVEKPKVEIPVVDEEIEISQPEITEESVESVVEPEIKEESVEQVNEPVVTTEKVAASKPIEVNEDAEDAFRQKLMEELLADDFSVEPETEEWPQDIFGNNANKTEEKPVEPAPVVKEETTETKPIASAEDELPEVSAEEQAEIDRKKAETLAKFMSKTSPKNPDEEESDNNTSESQPEIKVEKKITPTPEKKVEKIQKKEKPTSSIAAKEATDEKNKKLENTVQVIGFNLGEEAYGIDINSIREINRITSITLVPNVPDYVEGVINLRGNVIPIINLRVKTKMPKKDFNSSTRVIIIETNNFVVGFIVDAVNEVLRIPESIITPPPAIAVSEAAEYIKSVARTESGLIILLDTEKLIDRKDFL